MEAKLYVGNLSYGTTEDELRQLFGAAGSVVTVDIIKDRDSGRSKGFAFITMGNQAEAESAISMFNGKDVGGRALTVNIARPREERGPGGGGGGGRRYGGGGGGGGGYGGGGGGYGGGGGGGGGRDRDRNRGSGGGTRRY
jgi:RNA recognition motif-containing protein